MTQERRDRAGKCLRCGGDRDNDDKKQCSDCLTGIQVRGKLRRQTLKWRAIQARGARCEVCGFNERPDLLEWHHWELTKEGDTRSYIQRLCDIIEGTDQKLLLVCPICHRSLHADNLVFRPPSQFRRNN